MDDVNPTIKWHYCVTCVSKYPSDAQYGQATESFLANVGPAIQVAGKLAIANFGSWSTYSSVVNPWVRYLSGAMDENFLKWGETAGIGYADPTTWAVQLREEQYTESLGKLFIGATGSSTNDTGAATYGYATMLLGSTGNADFYMGDELADPTDFPTYHLQLGRPVGAESASASGVHRRAVQQRNRPGQPEHVESKGVARGYLHWIRADAGDGRDDGAADGPRARAG